jgi:hypothetical protein
MDQMANSQSPLRWVNRQKLRLEETLAQVDVPVTCHYHNIRRLHKIHVRTDKECKHNLLAYYHS